MPLDGTFAIAPRKAAPGAAAFRAVRSRWTSGDLNHLFHRQQVELSRAASAPSAGARGVHAELARLYEDAIEQVTGGEIRFRLAAA
jgi:hypothetical protein